MQINWNCHIYSIINVLTHNYDVYLLCDDYLFLSRLHSVNETRKSDLIFLIADENSKIAIIVNKFLILYPAIPISIQGFN